jgi:hypothetical protein
MNRPNNNGQNWLNYNQHHNWIEGLINQYLLIDNTIWLPTKPYSIQWTGILFNFVYNLQLTTFIKREKNQRSSVIIKQHIKFNNHH